MTVKAENNIPTFLIVQPRIFLEPRRAKKTFFAYQKSTEEKKFWMVSGITSTFRDVLDEVSRDATTGDSFAATDSDNSS